jgi:lysyl-tRNA synthetase, class II
MRRLFQLIIARLSAVTRSSKGLVEMTFEAIARRDSIVRALREFLHRQFFYELATPVVRRVDDGLAGRIRVSHDGGVFLRESIGPPLRYNLKFTPRVFEIGPCFRKETPDRTHGREFTMLELYAANEDFGFLFQLAEDLMVNLLQVKPERVSIIEQLAVIFRFDPTRPPPDLVADMANELGVSTKVQPHEVVDSFIAERIEPLSMGRCVFFYDYPSGASDPCARFAIERGAVNRFELFVNGLEVINGYEDETDIPAFIERASALGLYSTEQAIVQDDIEKDITPIRSVGLGIGIERLCMAAAKERDISTFQHSQEFSGLS